MITGCSSQGKKAENQENELTNKIHNENKLLSIQEECYTSDVIFDSTGEPNVEVNYPSISGLNNNITSKINEQIKLSAMGDVESNEIYQRSDEMIYIKFELYADENILSVKFTGGLADGRMKLVSSLNLDLHTGERMMFSDLYNVNQELVDYLFGREFYHEDERIYDSHQYAIEHYYDGILTGLYESDTDEYYTNGEEDKLYVYSYYKKDTIELIFYHGFNALGRYYSEELTYDELHVFKK